MVALFDLERHEPLVSQPWDAAAVRAAIDEIVRDTCAARRDDGWPAHPLDDGVKDGSCSLYVGAAGVLWALVHLAREGAIAADPGWPAAARALPDVYRARPDTSRAVPSYFLGESGILLAALVTMRGAQPEQPSALLAERLLEVVQSNTHNPTLEALWGAPGSALAAIFAHELTGDERWRAVYLDNIRALEGSWREHDGDGCALWMQDLYGRQRRILGAAHGFAGNVFCFLRGRALLPDATVDAAMQRAVRTLRATVELAAGRANWPSDTGRERFFVQWCHGAPGIVT
ncbi:MAG TPA: lanthionine synthetase LanC family protein, partial [Polyangiaceae bacterium]|nr:lanthionine synthetase LanC family protein [Polyangiaceae bacterium]